jgi:hypothetical protein
LLRRLGFHARGSDGGVIDLELELDSTSSRVAGAASNGPQAGEARIVEVVGAGGLERFRQAAETPFNLVYEARPERRGTPDQAASSPTAAPTFARHAR